MCCIVHNSYTFVITTFKYHVVNYYSFRVVLMTVTAEKCRANSMARKTSATFDNGEVLSGRLPNDGQRYSGHSQVPITRRSGALVIMQSSTDQNRGYDL